MRKSKSVKVGLVAVLAATLLAGCEDGPPSTRLCADANGNVAEDQWCEEKEKNPGVARFNPYRWYYINGVHNSGAYPIGSRISGGSYVAPSVGSISSRSGTVVRGGFGSSAAGHSSGG